MPRPKPLGTPSAKDAGKVSVYESSTLFCIGRSKVEANTPSRHGPPFNSSLKVSQAFEGCLAEQSTALVLRLPRVFFGLWRSIRVSLAKDQRHTPVSQVPECRRHSRHFRGCWTRTGSVLAQNSNAVFPRNAGGAGEAGGAAGRAALPATDPSACRQQRRPATGGAGSRAAAAGGAAGQLERRRCRYGWFLVLWPLLAST